MTDLIQAAREKLRSAPVGCAMHDGTMARLAPIHDALLKIAEMFAERADAQNCVCRFVDFIGESAPCGTCRMYEALADLEKAVRSCP